MITSNQNQLLKGTENLLQKVRNPKAVLQSNLIFAQNFLQTGTSSLQARLNQLGFILGFKQLHPSKTGEAGILSSVYCLDFSVVILAVVLVAFQYSSP